MKLEARVESLYVGDSSGLEKTPRPFLEVAFEGIVGDKHAGFSKAADSRNTEYRKGTQMRNDRQWSAVSSEELAAIAQRMGIPYVDPGWMGANLALAGIPNLTNLPKGSKLVFPEDAVLLVEAENLPCTGPGKVIAAKYPDSGLKANQFPKAAIGRRGLVGAVERPGIIRAQDLIEIDIYQPKFYSIPPTI